MWKKAIGMGLVVLTVTLSGCATSAQETMIPDVEEDFVPMVSVTGVVAPAIWVTISAQVDGEVNEVLVEPGSAVAEGDLLARVDATDAQLAVQQAEAAVGTAQAQLALVQASARPGQVAVAKGHIIVAQAALSQATILRDQLESGATEAEIAVAQAQVTVAQAALSQAAAQRDQLKLGATEAEIAGAQAQVAAAQTEHLAAREVHDQTMKCFRITQPDGSKKKICPALGTLEEQARSALHAANEALTASQTQLDALIAGAAGQRRTAEAAVGVAAAQRDVAQAQLDALVVGAAHQYRIAEATVDVAAAEQDVAQAQQDLLMADPLVEEIAVAEAAVDQAQVALAAAQEALNRYEIRAPFAGIVGSVEVRPWELVSPAQPLVTLGDLTTLQVETSDLDEIDVVQVAANQSVIVTFDAIAERVFPGRIARISPMVESGTGGVHFTIIVTLDEIDPSIRWGMTAFVDIEIED